MTKTKMLEKKYGGKWTYGGAFSSFWSCDDGSIVRKCAPPVDEFDNPLGNGNYYYYAPNKVGVIHYFEGGNGLGFFIAPKGSF